MGHASHILVVMSLIHDCTVFIRPKRKTLRIISIDAAMIFHFRLERLKVMNSRDAEAEK